MPITTRAGKGSALTFDEMDANWAYLDGRVIMPHVLAGGGLIEAFKLESGLPVYPLKNGDFTGEYDMAPAIRHAQILSMQAGPSAYGVLLAGAMVIRSAVVEIPGVARIFGHGHNGSNLIWDGPNGDYAWRSGNLAQDLWRFPVSAVDTSVGGQVTVTIGTGEVSVKPVFDLAASWMGINYNTVADVPVAVDAFGQWLALFVTLGLTDESGGYANLPVQAIDVANRQITLTGTIAFTPTHLHAPGLADNGTTYDADESVAETHLYPVVDNIQVNCRDQGKVLQDIERGVKGLPDAQTRWNNIEFRDPLDPFFNFDSDSIINQQVLRSLPTPATISSVDSTVRDFQASGTTQGAVVLASDNGQSFWVGKNKVYYTSQGATTIDESYAIELEANVAGWHIPGILIIEDSANAIKFNSRNHNISLHMEFNNVGAIGWGAPSTLSANGWEGRLATFDRNGRFSDIKIEGIVRANTNNRQGFHVQCALYAEAPTGLDTGLDPTDDLLTGADVAMPYMFRDIHFDLTTTNYDSAQGAQNTLIDWIDERKPIWDNATAYVRNDYLQLVDTADAPRYKAIVDNPTVGVSPDSDPAQWRLEGGGRNAWLGGFIEEQSSDPANIFIETWNCEVIIDHERDPSFHRRLIVDRPAMTMDPEQDVVRVQPPVGGGTYDVFPGKYNRTHVWRKEGGGDLVFSPGSRNDGSIKNRKATQTLPNGSVATLTRDGAEMLVRHDGDGGVSIAAHDQTETVGDVTSLALDVSDFGKTLVIEATSPCTVSIPTIADLPADWYVILTQTGSAAVTISGVSGVGSLAQYEQVTVSRRGSVLVGH